MSQKIIRAELNECIPFQAGIEPPQKIVENPIERSLTTRIPHK
jgi:hypothetical protein